jgi:4,5-DOPA dioxygenase extradiol
VFVSHGAPTVLFELESPAYNALTDWPERLGLQEAGAQPKAVLVISAHWETETPTLSAALEPETIHDFAGFPSRCYDLFYITEGAPALAERIATMITAAGLAESVAVDQHRGLDHGAWVPLMLAFPAGHLPVVELSVQPGRSPADHLALGRALAPLRNEGVLILGSGGAVHNLDHWAYESHRVEPWAHRFDDALAAAVMANDSAAVIALLESTEGRLAHPTPEHLLPLLVVMGAAAETTGYPSTAHELHRGFQDGSLSMAAYAFS